MNERQKGVASGRKFAGIEIPPDLKRSNFFVMYFANFFCGCLMALPAILMPAFLKQVIDIPEDQAGSINSGLQNMGQVATVLFVGLVGFLSDRVGRRILAIIGFFIAGVFCILFYYTKDISFAFGITSMGGQIFVVFVAAFIIGIGRILAYPQFITMVADYTFQQDRGKGMAIHGITMGLGSVFVFGVLAQIARKTGLLSLFYMSGAIGFLGAAISRVWLVDRMPKEKTKMLRFGEIWKVVSKNLSLKATYAITFVTRADMMVMGTFLIVWMVYMAVDLGITPIKATAMGGIVMMVQGLSALIAYPIIGVLLDRWGRVPVIIITLMMAGAGYCLIAVVNNPFSLVMFILIILQGVGTAGALVGSQTLATDVSPKPLLGSILGGLNTMSPLGILFFLQFGGFLFDKLGYWSPFALKGIADLACGLWILAIRKRIVLSQEEIR